MNAKAISQTILQQLGGNKFIAMTGCKGFLFDSDGSLQFTMPRGRWGVNRCKVTLDGDDTYMVTFYKFNRSTLELTQISATSGIYAGELRTHFETETGLLTSLA